MKRIVLLLMVVLAIGCSKDKKEEDFSQYKLNVPDWLIGDYKYSSWGITYDFGFSKNNYYFSHEDKRNFFEMFKSRLVKEGEYSYWNYKVYYFISYATQTKKYLKYTFEMKIKKCSFELNGEKINLCTEENKNDREIRRVFEEVTDSGRTIEKISDNTYTYKKLK